MNKTIINNKKAEKKHVHSAILASILIQLELVSQIKVVPSLLIVVCVVQQSVLLVPVAII